MAIPGRQAPPGHVASPSRTFFVTSSTLGKRSLFQSTPVAELFLKVLFEYRDAGKYRLHEFVLMRDHFHLLITVDAEMTVERAVQFIKGGFSHRAAKELGLKGTLWQRGFSELRVLDRNSLIAQSSYIRNNPVRAHMVEQPQEYRYSSAYPGYVLDPEPQGLKPTALLA